MRPRAVTVKHMNRRVCGFVAKDFVEERLGPFEQPGRQGNLASVGPVTPE